MELFNRLRAYQDHRAGRRLEILPAAGRSAEKQWISLDSLLRMKLDDRPIPAVRCGNCALRSTALRAAYLAHSPAEFNAASHKFLGMVREMGPQLGAYPCVAHDRSGSGLQPLGPLPFRLGVDAGRLPLRALADGGSGWMEASLPGWDWRPM